MSKTNGVDTDWFADQIAALSAANQVLRLELAEAKCAVKDKADEIVELKKELSAWIESDKQLTIRYMRHGRIVRAAMDLYDAGFFVGGHTSLTELSDACSVIRNFKETP